jgi:hypothetical protein
MQGPQDMKNTKTYEMISDKYEMAAKAKEESRLNKMQVS